ncbi:adenylate cyclase [Gammaproteobacteria bacterium]
MMLSNTHSSAQGFPIQLSRSTWQFLLVIMIATCSTFSMQQLGWLRPLENIYYDYWHQFSGKRHEAQYTAVIAVDDETLLQFKDDPLAFWAPYWAQAMDIVRRVGVKAIGLDFIYTVSAEAWLEKLNLPDSIASRSYDSPLREQLASGKVTLITYIVENAKGESELLMPPMDQLALLPRQFSDTGIANLEPDSDNLVRNFYPVLDPSNPAGLAFPLQLALRAADLDPTAPSWTLHGEEITRAFLLRRIGYLGPPGTIPTLSMSRLLKPEALSDPQVQALHDHIVIISANNAGTPDRHLTPYSRGIFGFSSDQMTGGEIHANIIETLLNGRYPHTLPLWLEWGYLLVGLAFVVVCYLRLHPLQGFAVGTGIGLLCMIPAYFMFLHDLILPVGSVQTAIMIAFLSSIGLRLTGEERQRAKLREQFGRYVSDDVVNILTEGKRPNLAGEEIEVTVLFSDIRNFTTMSEKLSPREVVEMLNAYFSRTCEPILAQGGMIDKYIGDAVMAIFGSPVRYSDHARRALIAAVKIREQARQFRNWMTQHFPDRGLPEFNIGIGLHTGLAVIGDIGSVKRTEFTAIGDTVNTAARLEGVTKEICCPLVASAQTVHAAGAGVKTGRCETIKVKGRNEPIEVFEIVALEGDTDMSCVVVRN